MDIIANQVLPDGSKVIFIAVPAHLHVIVGYLLEGLDGYCYHTIADYEGQKVLRLTVVPDYYSEITSFIEDMENFIYDRH